MRDSDKTQTNDYLCVVSDWQGSLGSVGSAYPIYCVTENRVVSEPMDEFPDPGYIFLPSRQRLETWDLVLIRPQPNPKYTGPTGSQAYYIPASQKIPNFETRHDQFAILLDIESFDTAVSDFTFTNPRIPVTPLFFVRDNKGDIYGPILRKQRPLLSDYGSLAQIRWEPARSDSIVYRFSENELEKQKVSVVKYVFADNFRSSIVNYPFFFLRGSLPQLSSLHYVDTMSVQGLVDWYSKVKVLTESSHKEFSRVFQKNLAVAGDTPPEVVASRMAKLSSLLKLLREMEAERTSLVKHYLESEEGKRLIKEALALEVQRRQPEIEQDLKKLQLDQVRQKERTEAELRKVAEEAKQQRAAIEKENDALRKERASLVTAVASLEKELATKSEQLVAKLGEHLPLLAVMSGTIGGRGIEAKQLQPDEPKTEKSHWSTVLPEPPTKKVIKVPDEGLYVKQLQHSIALDTGLLFEEDFIANVFACLKFSLLNLITSPPGLGKSSFVRALAKALGHTNSLLEIVVRRAWSDDKHLLGFFDAFHGRYDPGPAGLTAHLLKAERDWQADRQGLYFVLLNEFNLSSPEYYFSQLLETTSLPRDRRSVQLFDSSFVSGDDGSISEISIYPNVSFWGTINHDETTERLSPRLLSRTGMIFLSPRDVKLVDAQEREAFHELSFGLAAGQLEDTFVRSHSQCPEALWEQLLMPLEVLTSIDKLELLSPRTQLNLRAYLANANQLMRETKAGDFAFEQHILPSIRGAGDDFEKDINALREELEKVGFERSARHVERSIHLARQNFGQIDLLMY